MASKTRIPVADRYKFFEFPGIFRSPKYDYALVRGNKDTKSGANDPDGKELPFTSDSAIGIKRRLRKKVDKWEKSAIILAVPVWRLSSAG